MRILFLDDKHERHKIFKSRSIGCVVDCAFTAQEAIDLLGRNTYELVMLDHELSEEFEMQMREDTEDGRTVARWCAECPDRFASTVFVVHSLNLPAGSIMVDTLLNAGLDARQVPFGWKKFLRTATGCDFS